MRGSEHVIVVDPSLFPATRILANHSPPNFDCCLANTTPFGNSLIWRPDHSPGRQITPWPGRGIKAGLCPRLPLSFPHISTTLTTTTSSAQLHPHIYIHYNIFIHTSSSTHLLHPNDFIHIFQSTPICANNNCRLYVAAHFSFLGNEYTHFLTTHFHDGTDSPHSSLHTSLRGIRAFQS